MHLNEWRDIIHKNAETHGWWSEPRAFSEVIALCHSELSEALEEDRANRGNLWEGVNGKPEGRAVEMADCIIRILDWCGKEQIDIEDIIAQKHRYNISRPWKHGKTY